MKVYNFKTGVYEEPVELDSLTDEQARCYLSQDASVQGLYEVYRGMGKSIVESMLLANKAFVEAAQKYK